MLLYWLPILTFFQFSAGNKQLMCVKSNVKIAIDGNITPTEWDRSMTIALKDIYRKKSNNSMTVRAVWDMDNLYFAFHVQDSNLLATRKVQDDPDLFLDDMVEFLIDTRNSRDSCWNRNDIVYHINILGQKKDDRGTAECRTDASWNGKAVFAVKIAGSINDTADIDRGYDVEVRIGWKELDVKPRDGTTIGIDFANGDNGKLFDWVGAGPFRSPFAFGMLTLKDN